MRQTSKIFFWTLVSCLLLVSCKEEEKTLPVLGNNKIVDGEEVPHFIPDFAYLSQDSAIITNEFLKKHIYLADCFFTHCPSICPKVTKQMLRIHDEYKSNDKVKLVSFTLDPKRDTPDRLKMYGDNLDIDHDKWYMLHGDKEATYDLCFEFFISAMDDELAPGGINHSGQIVLVDQQNHIRAFADGTDPEAVDDLLKDIKILLKEIEEKSN